MQKVLCKHKYIPVQYSFSTHLLALNSGTGAGMGAMSGGMSRGQPISAAAPPVPQRQASQRAPFAKAAETVSFADLASQVRDSNPDFQTPGPLLDSQEGKLINQIYGTLGRAGTAPSIPMQVH